MEATTYWSPSESQAPPDKLECECVGVSACPEGLGGKGQGERERDQEKEETPLPFVHFLSEYDTVPRVITAIARP